MLPNEQMPTDGAPLTQSQGSGLPLPKNADLKFWRSEVERSENVDKNYHAEWQENVQWYVGASPDAAKATGDFVNVNVDFYQVEQKQAQLFYETPELQIRGTGPLEGQDTILQAHRALLNELLGDDHADVLTTVQTSIKSCLTVENTAAVLIGYEPTLREVPAPQMPGSILGLNSPIQVPIHEQWYALPFSRKKLLKPADFKSTDWDRAPWLGMRFRMPLAVAKRSKLVPPDFEGTNTRDEYIVDDQTKGAADTSGLNYVDGQAIWYKAAMFDEAATHPELYRELILIDGLEQEARHRDSPHQTLGPDGRLTPDSMHGNPIHPLTIRSVPDSSNVPSDSQMTRPLVRELCKFRTQMVQERDANRAMYGYDISKLPPETIAKIERRETGALIALEEGALMQGGAGGIMAPLIIPSANRQTYIANDYITHDIEKTLAIDATGAGVGNGDEESATKTATVDRNRSVRLDAERRQVLRWYLKLVTKFSALVCRYMTPQMAANYIGQQRAAVWAQWDKKTLDGRAVFTAKPDSQIRLDMAKERKFWMDIYQFTAKDPNTVRIELLKKLFSMAGEDPSKLVVDKLPEQPQKPNLGFTFKGEDLIGPQGPIVREIMAQCGLEISQNAISDSAGQLMKQLALGLRDADGKATPAAQRRPEHGGPVEQVRPLSQQQGDLSGDRSGPKVGAA